MFRFIRNIVSYIIFIILKLFFGRKTINPSEDIVFMNTGSLGDVVISTILMDNESLLKDKLYFICKDIYSGLFFSYKGKFNFIFLNVTRYKYNIFYRISFLIKLHKINAKSFYNLTAERGMINDEISFLSGCRNVYTTCSKHTYLGNFFGNLSDRRYTNILYSDIQNEYGKHTLLLKEISGSDDIKLYNNNLVNFDEKHILSQYAVIAPFSSNKEKQWDVNKFKELADIIARYCKVVLISGPKEFSELLKIGADNPNIECEITDLGQLINLINYSALFIGNDSGPAHIAFKLNKKSVIIISEEHYNNCFPYDLENKNIKYISGKFIRDISVDNVIKLVKELL